jgi:UDP-3-O-[3-hydroxymyristoyl] glucosamine N-acyltransferase
VHYAISFFNLTLIFVEKTIHLNEVINLLGIEIITIYGNPAGKQIKYLKDRESVDQYTLDWINPLRIDKQQIVESTPAFAIIVDTDIEYTNTMLKNQKVLLVVNNPKLAVAKVGNYFFVKKKKQGIDKSAWIHRDAKIGDSPFIGRNVTIGKSILGNNVQIQSNVIIHDDVIIGDGVIVKCGAVLGAEGTGYVEDNNGNLIKFPRLGKLIIKNNVDIGSNTVIDKGALSDTVIGLGTKISALCQISHNVVIGSNCIITSNVTISGSVILGDNVWVSPNACFKGHQHIGSNSIIGLGAVVLKDVPSGETWAGNPAKKLK